MRVIRPCFQMQRYLCDCEELGEEVGTPAGYLPKQATKNTTAHALSQGPKTLYHQSEQLLKSWWALGSGQLLKVHEPSNPSLRSFSKAQPTHQTRQPCPAQKPPSSARPPTHATKLEWVSQDTRRIRPLWIIVHQRRPVVWPIRS